MNDQKLLELLRQANIDEEDIDENETLLFNFSCFYLENASLVEIVSKLMREELLNLAERLLTNKY
jgi:hypothetical protein